VLLAIKKQGINLLWHELAHERQAVRCLILEHFTPDTKRSGGNGTDNERSDFIFYLSTYLFIFVVY
jgi:hypothetical protein